MHDKVCKKCGRPFKAKYKQTRYCSDGCRTAVYFETKGRYRKTRAEYTAERNDMSRLRFLPYAKSGAPQKEIAEELGISKQAVSEALQRLGLWDKWKTNREAAKRRVARERLRGLPMCKRCGKRQVAGLYLKLCRKCGASRYFHYKEGHKCRKCGKPTVPGKRRKGYCLNCARRIPGRLITCPLCGRDAPADSHGLCLTCYHRLRERAKAIMAGRPMWLKKVYNQELEREIIKKIIDRKQAGLKGRKSA